MSFPNLSGHAAKVAGKGFDLTVSRAIEVLEILNDVGRPVPLRQIVNRSGLSQTATYRLLRTLERHSVVQKYADARGYGLGWRLAVYANGLFQHLPYSSILSEVMAELHAATGETVSVQMLAGHRWICIASQAGVDALVHRVDVGRISPIALGSAGKAMLAFLDRSQVEAARRAVQPGDFGPNGKAALARLAERLEEIRLSGIAASFEETTAGVAGLAAPIFGTDNTVLGSVGISGPGFRWNIVRMREHAPALRQQAKRLSAAFGCRVQHNWRNVGPPFELAPRA